MRTHIWPIKLILFWELFSPKLSGCLPLFVWSYDAEFVKNFSSYFRIVGALSEDVEITVRMSVVSLHIVCNEQDVVVWILAVFLLFFSCCPRWKSSVSDLVSGLRQVVPVMEVIWADGCRYSSTSGKLTVPEYEQNFIKFRDQIIQTDKKQFGRTGRFSVLLLSFCSRPGLMFGHTRGKQVMCHFRCLSCL